MLVKRLLERKGAGEELAPEEIRELIAAYTAGDVPDYQMASFAMAVRCRGMSAVETATLTSAMAESGDAVSWDDLGRPTADKHSTGGVGDKLSLIIQPIVAACGVATPSLTGRGLGHTGGTADKLEAIPGYRAGLSLTEYREVVRRCGCSLTVQTAEIAPADRKLYALRDVTGTVPSIPLITASILSKKLAEGAGTLVFDVKCGAGAFMKTPADAHALATGLVEAAKLAGRKSAALVTRMEEPIGRAVGNANETREAYDVLAGSADPLLADEKELSLRFAALMIALAKGVGEDVARQEAEDALASGRARRVFEEMVKLHGGDWTAFDAVRPSETREVRAERDGYVVRIDALGIAEAALLLGAGRAKAGDAIDPTAGVTLAVAAGSRVAKGDVLLVLETTSHADACASAAAKAASSFAFADTAPAACAPVIERIG